jgi:hypothetical protein
MNHTIKGIIIVVAITSMLVLGATTTTPIMQNSFAHKKSDFNRADPDPNTNINTNSADSSSSSDATASNTNNIDNTATASSNQNQNACAIALTCSQGSTTVTPSPADPCPHSPYTDFVAGTGCQDGEPQTTCNPPTIGGQTATPTTSSICTALLASGLPSDTFQNDCHNAGGAVFVNRITGERGCTFPTTQTCPTPTGSTQTPTVAENGRCTIQPGAT